MVLPHTMNRAWLQLLYLVVQHPSIARTFHFPFLFITTTTNEEKRNNIAGLWNIWKVMKCSQLITWPMISPKFQPFYVHDLVDLSQRKRKGRLLEHINHILLTCDGAAPASRANHQDSNFLFPQKPTVFENKKNAASGEITLLFQPPNCHFWRAANLSFLCSLSAWIQEPTMTQWSKDS